VKLATHYRQTERRTYKLGYIVTTVRMDSPACIRVKAFGIYALR
jgi:hypothetical protein